MLCHCIPPAIVEKKASKNGKEYFVCASIVKKCDYYSFAGTDQFPLSLNNKLNNNRSSIAISLYTYDLYQHTLGFSSNRNSMINRANKKMGVGSLKLKCQFSNFQIGNIS